MRRAASHSAECLGMRSPASFLLFTLGVPLSRREVSLSPNWTSVELTPSLDVSAAAFLLTWCKVMDGRVRMMPGSRTGGRSVVDADTAFTSLVVSARHVRLRAARRIPGNACMLCDCGYNLACSSNECDVKSAESDDPLGLRRPCLFATLSGSEAQTPGDVSTLLIPATVQLGGDHCAEP